MIGLHTNVLDRYIIQDDLKQGAKAAKLIERMTAQAPVYVTLVTLARDQIVQVLEVVLRSRQLLVDQAELSLRALRVYGAGNADFINCLIARGAAPAGCAQAMTFDVAASKTAGMTLIK